MMSIVFPVFLLGWFACLSAIIPDDSGEKLSFVIAVELAIVFLMATLDQHIAPTGYDQHGAILINVIICANVVLLISFFKTLIMTHLIKQSRSNSNKISSNDSSNDSKTNWEKLDKYVTSILFSFISLVTLIMQS